MVRIHVGCGWIITVTVFLFKKFVTILITHQHIAEDATSKWRSKNDFQKSSKRFKLHWVASRSKWVLTAVFSPEISDSIGASLRGSGGSLYSEMQRRIMSHHVASHTSTLYTLHHKCQCIFLYYTLHARFACITKTNWWPWTFNCLKMECMDTNDEKKSIFFKFIHEYMWCSCNSTYYLTTLYVTT